jgi:hypothetical protein
MISQTETAVNAIDPLANITVNIPRVLVCRKVTPAMKEIYRGLYWKGLPSVGEPKVTISDRKILDRQNNQLDE